MKQEHKEYILDNRNKKPSQLAKELNIPERKVNKFLQQATEKSSPSKPLSIKFLLLSHILIIALGFIAYTNSLNGAFVYDDLSIIRDNGFIKEPSEIISCFSQNLFAGAGKEGAFYRPLQMASYVINYAIGKLDVRGYHFVNIILHILVALSIFWFIEILFRNGILSLMTAILFVVHPIHTEAVSYISGRCDPMALFFMLSCAIIYIKLLNQNRFNIAGYCLMLLCYIAALSSKEHSLILPILLLFYHYVFGQRIKVAEFLSLVGITIIYIVLRCTYLNALLPATGTDTVFDRIPGVFVALLTYIKLLFLPFPLHMEYGSKLFAWDDPKAILGLVLICIVLTFGYLKRKNKIILFSLGWFFLALLPVSNLFKINFYMAEHFLYIPSLGFFLLISYPLSILYNNGNRIIALAVLTSATVFFLVLTIRQNHYWRDPLTFYERTIKFASDSSNAYNNLGNIYYHQGNLTEASMYYNKANALNSSNAETNNNLGLIDEDKGDYDKAIADLDRAIELNPNYADAYNNLGNVYTSKGDFNQAIQDYDKALSLKPQLMQAYNNRGFAYEGNGNLTQAVLDYNKAIELNPNYAEAYANRGRAYGRKKDFNQVILDLNKAIELNSSFTQAYINRAVAFYFQKEYDKAWADVHRAEKLDGKIDGHFMEALKKASGREE